MYSIGNTKILFILAIIPVFLFGGLLHAFISHAHGDDHGGQPSAEWVSLHGALRHEDKVALFILIETLLLVVFVARLIPHTSVEYSMFMSSSLARRRDPRTRESLRRGIERYRAFA